MSGPERIWANAQEWPRGTGRIDVYASAKPDPDETSTEYIRADTVAKMIREACAKAIRDSLPDASEIYRMMLASPSKKRVTYAQTIAAAIRARGDT